MSTQRERSGIHLTGADSGWPVGSDAEPVPHKDGTGADEHAHVEGVGGGSVADAGVNEIQKVTFANATGGSFRLVDDDEVATVPIPAGSTIDVVREALEGLDSIAPGDVEVQSNGANYIIVFMGRYADANVPQLSAVDNTTGVGHSVTVSTLTQGSGEG
jgi:hypothetical protein